MKKPVFPVKILLICLFLSAIFLSAFTVVFTPEQEPQKKEIPGSKLFNDLVMHEVRIHFNVPAYWDSLKKFKEELDSNALTSFLPADLTIDGTKLAQVGIRFKGESSYEVQDDFKKSFKVKLNAYSKTTSYDGIKKINLNNSYADPTCMREKLYYDILRDMHCYAPRSAYARLYINNEYYGLYLMAETVDKEFLKNNFKDSTGDLFNGKPKAYFFWEDDDSLLYPKYYSLKSKKQHRTWSDFMHLIDLINNGNFLRDSIRKNFENTFDINQCLKVWALNNVLVNVDSYNMYYIHNFYIYKNSKTQRYLWLPYDGNYAFAAYTEDLTLSGTEKFKLLYLPDNREKRPLLSRLLKDSEYRQRYILFAEDIIQHYFTPEILNPRINRIEKLIKSAVYEDPMKKFSNDDFYNNLFNAVGDTAKAGKFQPGLKSFIVKRREYLQAQIAELRKLKIVK